MWVGIGLQIYAAALLLPLKASNFVMLGLVGLIIFSGLIREVPKNAQRFPLIACVALFYLFHVLALINSDDLYSAYKELERKVPLLFLPVLFLAVGKDVVNSNKRKILLVFSASSYLACVFLLVVALLRYSKSHDASVFYYIEFGSPLNFNPVYLAAYILLSFAFLTIEFTKDRWRPYLLVAAFFITSFFLILLSSKSALVLFSMICLYFIFTRIKSVRHKLAITALTIVVITAFISISDTTRNRLADVLNSEFKGILSNDYTQNATTYTGITQRISFWKVSMKELAGDGLLWFGVGTGDQKQYLNQAYEKYGLLQAGYVNFNLHNAYFEIILELGLTGFALFLAWLVAVLRVAAKSRDELFGIFLLLFLFPAVTESTLNVNKGIAFYSFMFCLFLSALTYAKTDKLSRAEAI